VNARGEIQFTHQDRSLTFAPPAPEAVLAPEQKALAYFNPNDPTFIHLTTGDGRVLGTWALRGRVPYQDQEALAQAMRYTHAARAAAQATAADLAAGQRDQLAAMRRHNEDLSRFITVAEAPEAGGSLDGGSVVDAFNAMAAAGTEMKINPAAIQPAVDSTQELLERAAKSQAAPIEEQNWE
jgi:hypothetical protein